MSAQALAAPCDAWLLVLVSICLFLTIYSSIGFYHSLILVCVLIHNIIVPSHLLRKRQIAAAAQDKERAIEELHLSNTMSMHGGR